MSVIPQSIINHRNMRKIYTAWVILLIGAIGIFTLTYSIEHTTTYMSEKSFTLFIVMASLSVVALILAILFKFTFRNEVMAWIFMELIAVFGLVVMLNYGWNGWFTMFHFTALGGLLALGPYLYFD